MAWTEISDWDYAGIGENFSPTDCGWYDTAPNEAFYVDPTDAASVDQSGTLTTFHANADLYCRIEVVGGAGSDYKEWLSSDNHISYDDYGHRLTTAISGLSVAAFNTAATGQQVRLKLKVPVTADLTSVTPGTGSTAGGTNVTLAGTDFIGVTEVKFDGTNATNVVVVSDTEITCTTPAHAAGTINVSVHAANGSSDTLTNGFEYTGGGGGGGNGNNLLLLGVG